MHKIECCIFFITRVSVCFCLLSWHAHGGIRRRRQEIKYWREKERASRVTNSSGTHCARTRCRRVPIRERYVYGPGRDENSLCTAWSNGEKKVEQVRDHETVAWRCVCATPRCLNVPTRSASEYIIWYF